MVRRKGKGKGKGKMVHKKTYNVRVKGRYNITLKVFSFKRKYISTQLTIAAGQSFYSVYSGSAVGTICQVFSFNSVPDYTDFTNLFDEYKINAAKVELLPLASAALTTTQDNIRIGSVIDYNDATAITETQAFEYQNCRYSPSTRPHRRYCKVMTPMEVTDISDTSYVAIDKPRWISVDYTGPKHLGMKLFSSTMGISANTQSFYVYVTLYFQCRNVR